MHWYDGTIAEAVTLSKQRNAIFVVFIEGDNDLSVEMAATIDNGDVLKRLANPANFLAIKLKSGSANYTHFAQIYQFVPVPSLFFIGRNGTPLEVVCAGVQPDNLATRIDRILEEHMKDKPNVHPSTSSGNVKQQTADLLTAEGGSSQPTAGPAKVDPPTAGLAKVEQSPTAGPAKVDHQPAPGLAEENHSKPETSSEPPKKVQKTQHVQITKSGKEYDVVCDGDVCTRVPRVGPTDPGPSTANVLIHHPQLNMEEPAVPQPVETPDIDEKIEKAKELIEARRREKAAKEKELEIQKELERRATGQGVTELKQWQADQELKQIQEERKREKMENNLARQRILEQIAQDRAERKARDQPTVVAQSVLVQPNVSHPPPNMKKARDQPTVVAQSILLQPNVSQPPPTAGDGGTRTRIQFKLPDGSSHSAHFDDAGTLADVRLYVADNLQLSSSNFSLWTAFPRRELTDPDATLRNLQLTPSAALLVLPRRTPNTVASPSAFAAVITFITQIFTQFVLEPSQQLYAWFLNRFNTGPPVSRPPTAVPPPAEPPRVSPGGLRRRGNIHRLGEERTPDDDNNTWNGNSTQQM